MSRQAYINKDIPISEIRNIKKDLEKFVLLYEKISFIEEIYDGASVKSAIEKRGKTPQTGYKWLKNWNENGVDALFRKEGSGKNSKLSDNQFKILRNNIIQKGLTNIRDIKREIQSEFGVTYSERHLYRIIFVLGLSDYLDSPDIK